jgi:hypothetical protein
LALEELKTEFPERYRRRMAVNESKNPKAPELAIAFCQGFSQSQGLHADNYMK